MILPSEAEMDVEVQELFVASVTTAMISLERLSQRSKPGVLVDSLDFGKYRKPTSLPAHGSNTDAVP